MYNTMNNPSAHPSYSHYYLLSPSTLFFFFFCTSYCFFLHILLFFCTSHCLLHILLFFAHLIVLHFFISLHILLLFLLFLPYVCPCVMLLIQFVFLLFCTLHWADLIRLHFTSSYALYNYYVTNKETLNLESQAKTLPSATAEEIQGLTSNPENFQFRGHRKCIALSASQCGMETSPIRTAKLCRELCA